MSRNENTGEKVVGSIETRILKLLLLHLGNPGDAFPYIESYMNGSIGTFIHHARKKTL